MFFSIYSVLKEQKGNANLQKIAEGGFTTAGPHYLGTNGGDPNSHPSIFYSRAQNAVDEGLGIIGHITWHPDVVNDTSGFVRGESMNAISEADIRAHVRQVMDFTLNDPLTNAATQKWYTLPEELRPWRAGEMRYLNIVADEVKNYDPLGRPVSMYNPNNRQASELSQIVNEGLDETLMGVYVTSEPMAERGARIALGVDRLVAASEATGTTPVVGMQLSTDFSIPEMNALRGLLGGVSLSDAIEHVIRHDTYQAILRGAEGVHIWSGCDCRTGLTTYSQQLDGYISVASDLNLELGLADVFLQGESRDDFTATVLTGPETVTYNGGLGVHTIDTVATADIAYDGDRYLFLANSSNSLLSIRVDGLPGGIPGSRVSDLFENALELQVDSVTGEMLLDLQPLEVIALKIAPGLEGDYDNDGIISAADFGVWRDSVGSGALLNESVSFGVVDTLDHAAWKRAFGGQPAAAVVASVPEPSSVLGCLALMAITQCRRSNGLSSISSAR